MEAIAWSYVNDGARFVAFGGSVARWLGGQVDTLWVLSARSLPRLLKYRRFRLATIHCTRKLQHTQNQDLTKARVCARIHTNNNYPVPYYHFDLETQIRKENDVHQNHGGSMDSL